MIVWNVNVYKKLVSKDGRDEINISARLLYALDLETKKGLNVSS